MKEGGGGGGGGEGRIRGESMGVQFETLHLKKRSVQILK